MKITRHFSYQRIVVESTAVFTFVDIIVELTNTAFVNSTDISIDVEMAVLSKLS